MFVFRSVPVPHSLMVPPRGGQTAPDPSWQDLIAQEARGGWNFLRVETCPLQFAATEEVALPYSVLIFYRTRRHRRPTPCRGAAGRS